MNDLLYPQVRIISVSKGHAREVGTIHQSIDRKWVLTDVTKDEDCDYEQWEIVGDMDWEDFTKVTFNDLTENIKICDVTKNPDEWQFLWDMLQDWKQYKEHVAERRNDES